MTRTVVLATLLLLSSQARADMIDYAFKFTNQATAIVDAQMLAGQYNSANGRSLAGWRGDHVFPNLTCWRPSQDTPGTDSEGHAITTHAPLTGYFVIVSLDTPAPITLLLNHAALQFALNRTRREQGLSFITRNNIAGIITDIACQPLPAMRNYYPLGGFN